MIKKGFKDATPVMAGYFPIAMAFGILAKTAGVSIVEGVMMSTFVYAGASQFMAVSMIAAGISPISILLATFLMNFRHFIMSASIRAKLNTVPSKYFPLIGFFLTDESFSVASMKEDIDDFNYLISLEVSCYISWGLGTLFGYLTGMFFPAILITAMGVALYALFVALLIPACKKSSEAILYASLAGIINTFLSQIPWISSSGSFAITVISVSMFAAYLNQMKGEAQYEQ